MQETEPKRILVIKLSAFGDFILSLRSFQAIRRHHPKADITLLTTSPYAKLAKASGCFNSVWEDERPQLLKITQWLKLRRRLVQGRFDRVYDLQRNDRTGTYYRLLPKPRPEWVGTVSGCSHFYKQPEGKIEHITVREETQLALAGITDIGLPDLSFIEADIGDLHIPRCTALLVPGGAAHRPEKRWPAERFAELAKHIVRLGVTPVLIGGKAEQEECAAIKEACSAALNLCGKTSLEQIAVIARKAQFAVGNDTGPMHLISASGCPTVVLFSHASDPRKVSPIGPDVRIVRVKDLADLPVEEVTAKLPEPTCDTAPKHERSEELELL